VQNIGVCVYVVYWEILAQYRYKMVELVIKHCRYVKALERCRFFLQKLKKSNTFILPKNVCYYLIY